MEHTDIRGKSTSGKFWTSMNHLRNVLSYVNVRYRLPFRLHTDTWKFHALSDEHGKIHPYMELSGWKMPFVFFYSSTCIAITKSIHKMHVTMPQHSVWKNTKPIAATPHVTVTVTHD